MNGSAKQKILAQVGVTIGAFVVWYFLFAFIALEWNPAAWGGPTDGKTDMSGVVRFAYVLVSAITTAFASIGIWI